MYWPVRPQLTARLLLTTACLLASSIGLVAPQALAQVTVQSNPVFSTPTPAEQKLGPMPKPFKGEVIEFEPTQPAASPVTAEQPATSPDALQAKPDELKIGRVTFEGNDHFRDFAIRQYLKPISKREGELMDTKALTAETKRINAQNGFKLKGVVSQNAETGTSDLHFDVYEQQPYQITLTADNQGSPGVGLWRGAIQATHSNLLGIGDQLSVQYLHAARTKRVVTDYAVPLNRWGGKLSFRYAYQHLDYDLLLNTDSQPEVIGQDNVWVLTVEQPIDKNRVWTPYFSTLWRHVTIDNNHHRTLKGDPRPVTFGVRFNKNDKYGNTLVDASSIVGSDWAGGDSKFWRFYLNSKRVVNLPKSNTLVFRATVQQTPDNLPIVQDLTLGGAYSVRGYTERVLIGDRGHFFSAEHYWPVPYLGKISPKLKGRVQGVTFFDFGQTWLDPTNSRFNPAISNDRDRTLLMSAGGGLRFRFCQYLQGFVDAAWIMGGRGRREIELVDHPDFRVHFGVRSDLLPKPWKTRAKS
jgi:hemolysin activation/secretion protein